MAKKEYKFGNLKKAETTKPIEQTGQIVDKEENRQYNKKEGIVYGRPSHLVDDKGEKVEARQMTVKLSKKTHRRLSNAVDDRYKGLKSKSHLIELAVIDYLSDYDLQTKQPSKDEINKLVEANNEYRRVKAEYTEKRNEAIKNKYGNLTPTKRRKEIKDIGTRFPAYSTIITQIEKAKPTKQPTEQENQILATQLFNDLSNFGIYTTMNYGKMVVKENGYFILKPTNEVE